MANLSTLFDFIDVFESYSKHLFRLDRLENLGFFFLKVNFVFYCLTGRAFRNECRKILCGLWALKDFHISCTLNPHTDKQPHYHQQMLLTDRNRIMISPQQQQLQQQRMKRSYL